MYKVLLVFFFIFSCLSYKEAIGEYSREQNQIDNVDVAFFDVSHIISGILQEKPEKPEKIKVPADIEGMTIEQIKVIFSSLEKKHQNKPANLWSLKYQLALLLKQKEPVVFCEIMKKLSETPAFPLKQLALIESYELCPFDCPLQFDPDSVSDWLRLRLAESFYKRQKIFNQTPQTLKALVYLAENISRKELKISYLQEAIILAKEQKNERVEQQVTQLLYQQSPSLNPKLEEKDYFLVAQDFRQNRQFTQAIQTYNKVLQSRQSSFKEKNLSFSGLDRIYKIQKDHDKRISNSEQWSFWLLQENTEESLVLYYRKKLDLARQKWNLDENQDAIEQINLLLKKPESKIIKEEALYLRGSIYLQENQAKLSLKDWSLALEILNEKNDKNKIDLMSNILWKRAWLFRQRKQYQSSLQDLEELQTVNKNVYTGFKVLFWLGITYLDLNHDELAKDSFEELIETDYYGYYGYYGLLARKILNQKPEIKKTDIVTEELFQNKTVENLIHWLSLFNETELLSRFLKTKESQILNTESSTEKEWLKIIWLRTKAKQYLNVFISFGKMDNSIKRVFLTKYTDLLFPLDFHKEVETASKMWQVDKALVFSIIRQESAFNMRARSPADAFGLMQLIPSTAIKTAEASQIPYRNFKDLYQPLTNISLGTAHIKSLLEEHDNSFLFSVSAYNAGNDSANRWKEELKGLDVLELIESIPYGETRTYIRLLIRNYVFYHNLLEPDTEEWFPDWLLQ